MADIRVKDLPLATGPTAPTGTDFVAIDGLTTRKTTISALGDVAVPVASQAEAEAGVNSSKRMTPLTTKQSIASEVGDTIASAAQGSLADSALQPSDIGTTAGTVAAGNDSRIVNALQPSDLSSTVVAGKGMKPTTFAGLNTLNIDTKLFFIQAEGYTTGTDVHSFRVDRRADYTGGSTGFENAAFLANNVVSASSTQSYEDAGLFIIDNFSPGPSQNCAGRFVGKKQSTGSTWSIANEAIDFTGVADPTSALLGVEQVIAANGTDVNNNRVAFDAVVARPQVSGSYSGAAAQAGAAFRATNQVADTAANRWKIGYEGVSVGASTGYDVVFDSSKALIAAGGAAIRLANGQKISLTTGLDRTIRYDTGAIRYNNNSVDHWVVQDDGTTDQFGPFKIQGRTVLDATAWTAYTPTLGAFAGTLTTATATGKHKIVGRVCFVEIVITATDIGTATGYLTATLPFAVVGRPTFCGIEDQSSGNTITGRGANGSSTIRIRRFDNIFPGPSGSIFLLSGHYEIA